MADSTRQALPLAFLQRLSDILPASKQQACLDSFTQSKRTSFRINSLKADADVLGPKLMQDGLSLTPIPWLAHAYHIPARQKTILSHSPYHDLGQLYIQNASSMLAAILLNPQPSDWILDLCAAPGGKTTHLAERMRNLGKISAVEAVKDRFFRLRENLVLHGVGNSQCYLKDGRQVWRNCPAQFDRILVDAPCSSEAKFSLRQPRSFAYWSEKKIKEMRRKQVRLLYSAIQSLKIGGTILYCTCTFAPEENEMVIDKMLRTFSPAIQVQPISLPKGMSTLPGLPEWRDKKFHASLARAVRILPDEVMSGFFMCMLSKKASTLP